jgi:hypothetical protein
MGRRRRLQFSWIRQWVTPKSMLCYTTMTIYPVLLPPTRLSISNTTTTIGRPHRHQRFPRCWSLARSEFNLSQLVSPRSRNRNNMKYPRYNENMLQHVTTVHDYLSSCVHPRCLSVCIHHSMYHVELIKDSVPRS